MRFRHAGTGDGGGVAFEAALTGDTVTEEPTSVTWSQPFGATPVLLADIQTYDGADPSTLRYTALNAAGGPSWSRDDLIDDMASSLQFHCTSAATTLNTVVQSGAPPDDRARRRFEKMTAGMMACAVRWDVLDRVPES